MAQTLTFLVASLLLFFSMVSGQNASTGAKTFTLLNNCKETIWPGIITKGDDTHGDGFDLKPGATAFYNAPSGWSGRIWARTGCKFDKNGTGTCLTGNCDTSLNCSVPSNPPNTIAEFTLGDTDFFDVSLVNGFNLPLVISPLNSKGNCSTAGCDGDLRQNCPSQLSVMSDGKVIACRSACDAFNTDEYCCRGSYSDPLACMPSNYSKAFKQVCPASSSYAFDRDETSIIACSATDYVVAFCASRNQTFCSYHDNKVSCNTSINHPNASSSPRVWWIPILVLLFSFTLQFNI